ncbi:MAG: endo-1,4-beta-xylanase [Spirochaetales bacterium]|nr:endo-1,4-beta-xylanase [Spirochaetales bacterium]
MKNVNRKRTTGFSLIVTLILLAAVLFSAASCEINSAKTDSNTVSVPDGPSFAMADGESKYLGSILGPTDQANGDYSLFIPDVDGDHNFDYYWNQVTAENDCKWGYLETDQDVFSSDTVANATAVYDYAKNHSIPFKWHTLIWGREDQDEGTWRAGLSDAEIRAEVEEWFNWVNTNFPDIEYIDVVNEALNEDLSYAGAFSGQVPGYVGAAQYEWIVWMFQKARDIFPSTTQLLINDYQIINGQQDDEYVDIIQTLLDNPLGIEQIIDGVGIQCHSFNVSENGGEIPGMIESVLDKIGALGLPIHISELDINIENETDQKDELQRVFEIFWDHPDVAGVTYWGYRWGKNWFDYTGLREDTGYEREALQWLWDYFGATVTYNVTYNANGGTGPVPTDAADYSSGDTVTVLFSPLPNRSGYTFGGWNTLSSGTGTNYTDPSSFTITSDVTLYAKWDTASASEIVRLRNDWTNGYLTLSNETEYGDRKLKSQPYNGSWNTQLWEKELISGNQYRFKSVATGKYLTIRTNGEDSTVICQTLDLSWGSQKWNVEDAGSGASRLRTEWAYDKALNASENSSYADVRNHTIDWSWGSMKWYIEPAF